MTYMIKNEKFRDIAWSQPVKSWMIVDDFFVFASDFWCHNVYSVEDKYFQNRLCNSGMRHILGRETSRFSTRNKSTNLLTSRDIVEWAFRNALWAVKGLPAEPPIKPPFLRAFEGLFTATTFLRKHQLLLLYYFHNVEILARCHR